MNGTLTPFAADYRERNAPNARLPLLARAAVFAIPRLNLPVMIGTGALAATVYRADGDFYHAAHLRADLRTRMGLAPARRSYGRASQAELQGEREFRREWMRTEYRLLQQGFVRQGAIYYGPDCTVDRLGLLSQRVITNAGVGYIVDAWQNLTEMESMNFHAMGTGAVAEAVGDSALGAEVESRVSGTQSEPASNQIRTIATITATAARAVTEHGLFSASSAGALWDRSVFTVVNLAISDSIQFTYTGTLTAGGT